MTTDRELLEAAARMVPCRECGMACEPGEYHPYAACLMFKACHNGNTVRDNLAAVMQHGRCVAAIGEKK